MNIKILNFTKNPLNTIGGAVGDCWASPIDNYEKNVKRAKECIMSGHGRVTEFADITIEISEVSARVIRELYTHIIGVTRIQESTRYVDCSHFGYFTPPEIAANEEALEVYNKIMEDIGNAYDDLIALGIKKEDVANILPLGMHTKIVLKINVRALENMANMRLCNRAYHEFRELMKLIKKEISKLDEEWKWIADNMLIPKCVKTGKCTEKFSCGLIKKE